MAVGDSETLTAREVAAALGMSPRWVRRQAQEGLLPALRFGRKAVRFDARAIEQFRTAAGAAHDSGAASETP